MSIAIPKYQETQNLEFKQSWRDEFMKEICGFANAQGGKLLIGVDDGGCMVGVAESKRLMEDIPNKIASVLGIATEVNLHEENGKDIIEIVVEPCEIPVTYKGVYYYRSGSTKQELKGAALQTFMLKKLGKAWDDVPRDTPKTDVIDSEIVEYFLKKAVAAGRLDATMRKADVQSVLENLNLITDDGKLKNAAILLFTRNPQKYIPAVQFKIGRFGSDNTELLVQDLIEGNILQMADEVMRTLDVKYLVRPIHYEGLYRKEPLEIPEEALRELIYNAIIHKDYTGPAILMWVYSDRIELWNYGNLPDGKDVSWLTGKHSSMPRNKNIANAFYRTGFIESWGRGIDKINNAFAAVGLEPPKFELWDNGIKVTIKRENYLKIDKHTTETEESASAGFGVKLRCKSSVKIGSTASAIIEILRSNPKATADGIAMALGKTTRAVEMQLRNLKDKNRIQRVGSDKGGYWNVIEG